ncbi:MAG: fibronectin type III domain-containing protein [Candidatus Moranbacteria bacterium]|nr:fibronectin type III domain-containing protein [Candidatus Moranbacteria bacterium]
MVVISFLSVLSDNGRWFIERISFVFTMSSEFFPIEELIEVTLELFRVVVGVLVISSLFFSTFELPIFDLVIPVSDFPLKEHRALLEGLEPKKEYVFRIQCTDSNGQSVNSGFIPFQLEGISAL